MFFQRASVPIGFAFGPMSIAPSALNSSTPDFARNAEQRSSPALPDPRRSYEEGAQPGTPSVSAGQGRGVWHCALSPQPAEDRSIRSASKKGSACRNAESKNNLQIRERSSVKGTAHQRQGHRRQGRQGRANGHSSAVCNFLSIAYFEPVSVTRGDPSSGNNILKKICFSSLIDRNMIT